MQAQSLRDFKDAMKLAVTLRDKQVDRLQHVVPNQESMSRKYELASELRVYELPM